MGFTKTNQIFFIDDASRKDSNINDLKIYLRCNSSIDSLCNIPLIMNLLLWCVKEGMDIKKNYQVSLIQQYITAITKKGNASASLDNLSQPNDQVIKNLAQFAFIAIQEDCCAFTVDEILELCKDQFQVSLHRLGSLNKMCELGLLNRLFYEAQNEIFEIFHFNHMTIQNYLAAYYITSLPDYELLELLHNTFWKIHYFNVWIMYVGITRGKNPAFKLFLSGNQTFETSGVSIKIPSDKINYFRYQLYCMEEADGHLDNTLLSHIDLQDQKLSHNHLRTLVALLSRSTNKQWKSLNLSNCKIDNQGCEVLCEIFHSSIELKFETIDISYNSFYLEYFSAICYLLKFCHVKNLIFSVDALYDTATTNLINNFIAMLKEI